MSSIKKNYFVIFIIFILFLNFFSGCTLLDIFNKTEFTISSWDVIDNDGFPSLFINFSCTDSVFIDIIGPNLNKIDSDYFFKGDYEKMFHLAEYRHSVNPGQYDLKVYDKNSNSIYSQTFTFQGSELSIVSSNQKWFKHEIETGVYSLFGLRINVKNNGDTPEYPYIIKMIMDSETITYLALPTVINPGFFGNVDCFIYKESKPQNETFEVQIQNNNFEILSLQSIKVDIKDNVIMKHYSFTFNNKVINIIFPKPDFLFNYYISMDRLYDEDYTSYILNPFDDSYIDVFIQFLMSGYNGKNDLDKINYVASFVQSLEYKSDSETNDSYEYPRYPIETLFNGDGGGDCEDKSILAAHILKNMGYDVVLFRFPNHMAIGVNLSNNSKIFYDHYIDNYYFLETTTGGKPLGFVPNDYVDSIMNVTMYPVISKPFLIHNWVDNNIIIYKNTDKGDIVKVTLIIENLGDIIAKNISVDAGFFDINDSILNYKIEMISSLDIQFKKQLIFTVNIPKYIITWFKTRIYLDGILEDEKESISSFP